MSTRPNPPALHESLASIVERRLGQRPSSRVIEADVATIVERRCRALGLPDAAAYVERVARAPEPELVHLAAAFTNGWTWFFRDHDAIVALAASLRAMRLARAARVWVAGCSTGEEAYAVAIACAEAGVVAQIVASDVDARRIEIARGAEYDAGALRRVPEGVMARWFEPIGEGRARVRRELRDAVTLRLHNLLDPPLTASGTGGWDAIVCRNVLLHCTDDSSRIVVAHLSSVIGASGIVLYGPSDPVPAPARPFARSSRPPRRSSPPPAAASPPPPPLPPPARTPGPLGVEALWNAALAHLARGAHAAARDVLGQLLEARPEHADAHMMLGNLWVAEHALERAADAYREATARAPLCAEAYFLAGALERKRGAWDEAVWALRRALFLDPDLWAARYLLAGVWERLGEHERAERELEETLRSMERRPRIEWRSGVDAIERLACPRDRVRALSEQRLGVRRGVVWAAGQEIGEVEG